MGFFFDKQYSVPDKYRYLLQNIMAEARETFIIPDFDPDLNKLELRENPNLGGEQVIKNSLDLLLIYLLRRANNRDAQQEFFISKINSSTELQDEIVRILSSKLYDTFVLDDLCPALRQDLSVHVFPRKDGHEHLSDLSQIKNRRIENPHSQKTILYGNR